MLLADSWSSIVVREKGSSSLEISWNRQPLDSSYIEGEDGKYLRIEVSEGVIEGKPGTPGIPLIKGPVVVPASGEALFNINEIEWEPLGKADLAPVPEWEGFPDGPYHPVYDPDPILYNVNSWFPEEPVSFKISGFMRNLRIGHLMIHPIRYNPVSRKLEQLKTLSAKITFTASSLTGAPLNDIEKSFVDKSLNPYQASNFATHRSRRRIESDILSMADSWFSFPVYSSGILKIDRSYLISMGIDPDALNPDNIRIFDDSWRELETSVPSELPELEEIPLYEIGLEDGSFDTGDALYFFGRGPSDWYIYDNILVYQLHRFSNENRYWMAIGGDFPTPARRLEYENPPKSDTVRTGWILHHVEYDQTYAKTGNDIQWGWERTDNKHITFLDMRIDPTKTASVRHRAVPVEGETVPYSASIVNGQSPDSATTLWFGARESFFNSAFEEGTNNIDIPFPGATVLFDYYEVIYHIDLTEKNGHLTFAGSDSAATYVFDGFSGQILVFDITDQTTLRLFQIEDLGDGSYAFSDSIGQRRYYISSVSNADTPELGNITTPVGLRQRDLSCDLLMIVPDGLQGDLAEYLSYREATGIDVEWVLVEDVLLEFGFGVNDPTAIRNFLRYIWLSAETVPSYVMLIGDATWDPRGITDPSPTYCPAALCVYNAPDDYYFAVTEGDKVPDYSGGRVPINTINEWRYFVAKLKKAESSIDYGPWRIRYIFSADDERKTGNEADTWQHTRQTSDYAQNLPSWAEQQMVYLVDYPLNSTGLKPTAQNDLISKWNSGSVLVNYIGHGNYRLLSHEELFEATGCIGRLQNDWKLPVLYSASCEVGLFYRTTGQCIAEQAVLLPEAGTCASIAATRMTISISNGPMDNRFIQNCWSTGEKTTIGAALLSAKSGNSYSSTEGQYVLFGDPSMQIGPPDLDINISASPESLLAGKTVSIQGEIIEGGTFREDFDGVAYIMVYDSWYFKTYESDIMSGSVTYFQPGKRLFIGPVDVSAGTFETEFVVPIDISYGTNQGKVVAYAHSENEEAVGYIADLTMTGDTSLVVTDTSGPEIVLDMKGEGFGDGAVICGGGDLIARLSDESGINISGAAGHAINLTVDGDEAASIDLSSFFSYDLNSYTEGSARYTIENPTPGLHTVRVKAWDNMGNSSVEEIEFEVSNCDIAISNALAYPNPFKDETEITFNIDTPADVSVRIYTLSGRFVNTISKHVEPAFGIVRWNGKDRHGTDVANGIYLAVIEARRLDGETDREIVKIARGR